MSEEVVDLKEVLERVQDDRELLLELFDIFIEDYPGKLDAIKQAVAKKDSEALRDAAHSMKGASGNLSAKRLYAMFLKVEQLAKANNMDGVEGLLKELDGAFSDFKNYAAKFKADFKK